MKNGSLWLDFELAVWLFPPRCERLSPLLTVTTPVQMFVFLFIKCIYLAPLTPSTDVQVRSLNVIDRESH